MAQERRCRAANTALPRWVAAQPSLEAIRSHPRVPQSLLTELEGLWARRAVQQQQDELEEDGYDPEYDQYDGYDPDQF